MTFVPDNYDALVVAMAGSPHVAGLLVLDNRRGVRRKALGALAMGAWGIGGQLLRNSFWGASEARRRQAYAGRGKGFWVRPSINDPATVELVRAGGFDLLVNARTRFLFRGDILAAAPLGGINVHHGLLPDQRGVMCDLWALGSGEGAGFSIHRMTEKIDDGEILRVEAMEAPPRDYLAYLARSAAREAEVLAALLDEVAAAGGRLPAGRPNQATAATRFRKNPTWAEVRRLRAAGVRF